jgi:hypothetical protein
MQDGADTTLLSWVPSAGVGRMVRNGLNFKSADLACAQERLLGQGHTDASQVKPGDFDPEATTAAARLSEHFSQGARRDQPGPVIRSVDAE